MPDQCGSDSVCLSCKDQVKASMLFALKTPAFCSTKDCTWSSNTDHPVSVPFTCSACCLHSAVEVQVRAVGCLLFLQLVFLLAHCCPPTDLCAGLLWALAQQAPGVLEALPSNMITESWTSSAGFLALPSTSPNDNFTSSLYWVKTRKRIRNLFLLQVMLIIV